MESSVNCPIVPASRSHNLVELLDLSYPSKLWIFHQEDAVKVKRNLV
jgi:hypothetical protein